MADLSRLLALRNGGRVVAARLIQKLQDIFANADMEPAQKIHELESKLVELKARYDMLEDMDQQILDLTGEEDVQQEIEATDAGNVIIQDAGDLCRYRINTLRRANPDVDHHPPAPSVSSRATSRPKIALPRFNGDILQWQQFWQAFVAEIESDASLADINKFNYLLGQLDPNVLSSVAGLTPSNENYVVLVDLLKERYGRKSKVIAAYMRALYNLQKPEANLKSLRGFYDQVESYVRGLESLGKPPDTYGDLLVCILLDKLPADVRKNVARQHDKDEFTLDQLRNVLKGEIRVMEAGQVSTLPPSQPPAIKQQFPSRQSATMFNGATGQKPPFHFPCVYCDADHPASQCTAVSSIEERKRIVQQKRLCFGCLSAKHTRNNCNSRNVCRICRRPHHTSLHDSSRPASVAATSVTNAHSQVKGSIVSQQVAVVAQKSSVNVVSYPFVFLKTAVIKIRSSKCEVKANSMFDEGAQRSWITRDLVKRLGLRAKTKECLITSGFAHASSGPEFFEVVEFGIQVNDGTTVFMRAIVIEYLVDPLEDNYRHNLQELPYLKNLNLAHPYIKEDLFSIDLLIGADFYWSFIEDERPIRGDGPTAIGSKIGYLVSGPLESVRVKKPVQTLSLHVQSVESADDFSFMWSLETLGIFPHQEKVSEAANYAKKCIKFADGKYIAQFPWKSDHPELVTNFNMVKNMTQATIKRLSRDGMLGVFADIIKDQLDRKFIEQVPSEPPPKGCHYIPYHYVKKESSTTPIRIVYNCSNKGWNGVSFNDCVETGAPLHNDQVHLLIRFRAHAIGIVADVEKAFHHIELHESDRDYLRWMWLSNPQDPDSPLVIYRFKVVPFGAKSSPFILNSVVMHHLSRNGSKVAADMQRSVFVDNVITGCDSQTEAESYFHQANSIMCGANLPLQAWGFSDRDLEKKLQEKGTFDASPESKTLGLIWDRNSDCLHVQVPNLSPLIGKVTKRDVLKGAGSFYDPLGFYAPIATSAKILIQDLCMKNVKLDEELASEHLEKWKEIVSSIVCATKQKIMSVRRSYFGAATAVRDLHVFCDASRRAYGAVAYLVHQGEVSFVESKARITPIKSQQKEEDRELSIPESELMAAYLGVLVATIIIAALEPLGIKLRVYLWSDSQIVHHWIAKEEGHPRQFITNRVKKIRDFNRTQAATWKYVPSAENPADILSRGASFKELKASKLWKEGPEWLSNRKNWPTWSVTEFKSSKVVHVAVKSADPVVKEEDIFSVIDPAKYSFDMLLRVTAQVFRLASNFRLKSSSRDLWNREPLNSEELQRAENIWIRAFQKRYFPTELAYLTSKKKSWRPALVSQLDLFLDTDRIIRCKGRLQNSTMSESAKYPALIPKHSDLSRLIITDVHERVFHYGTEITLAKLIQRYWIPSARAQVKRICRNCVKCRRDHGPAYKLPDPAPLPADRIRESYPFEVTGIDYTGAIPVRVKEEEDSVYILLFTCGVTRAIHLEVVENMTSGAFIDALRRFTSRHSIPRVIYSDNASTFVSASNILTQFFKQPDVAKELSNMRTTWKFIPKRAPWYGGWWERLIALTKTSLRKMVGRTKLSLVQLQTVVAQIEAILNDRPLMRVSTDPKSFEPLTPAHLLYGRRITTLPSNYEADEELEDPTYGRDMDSQILSKAYLKTQNVLRAFWRKWSTSYLPSLREHHQATKGPMKEIIKIGDVVQIHQDSKRSEWKLAVVEQLNRGADGKVRSAEIRTANGRTSRPINKLYPLEVFESSEKLIRSESEKRSATGAAAEVQSMSEVRVLPEIPFMSSIPIPVVDEVSTRPGRIQRRAARQAEENIKRMARMETVEEEEE